MQSIEYRIIVIDDEPNILLSIENCLNQQKIQVDSFTTSKKAFIAMQRQLYDCALIDIRLGNENGIQLFKQMLSSDINIPVIFMSGNASLNEAAESQKLGAYDFIEKPFSSEKLRITIDNCLNYFHLKNKLSGLEQANIQQKLIGEHPLMQQLKLEISKVSKTDASILIQGESGTGKELIASAVHNSSTRSNFELINVNCSAIPDNLIESALFGHTKGAFTGADKAKKGYFELAHKGTIFLDEIGDMSLSAQTSLLRVLESKEIQKIGAETFTEIDVRVIAATHKNLKQQVDVGHFREDLFYRLNVIPLISPSLRQRLSDLPMLVNHLITRLCKRHGIGIKQVDDNVINIFENYAWPGNVRELTNTLERMIIMGGTKLNSGDIPLDIIQSQKKLEHDISLKSYRQSAERELIINRLNQFGANISQVALSLDIDRTNLHKKMKLYRITRDNDFY